MLCPDNGPKFASLANVRHRTAEFLTDIQLQTLRGFVRQIV